MYEQQDPDIDDSSTQLKRKRASHDSPNGSMRPPAPPSSDIHNTSSAAVTNFRTVSACNRCRTRKNRCDQKLPACTGCEKSNTPCVGFDPVLNREIPRNYVMYLESRVQTLETILGDHGVPFPPATELAITTHLPSSDAPSHPPLTATYPEQDKYVPAHHIKEETQPVKRERSFTGPEKPSTTAISFASVVREAVRRHIPKSSKDQVKENDTFFGLYSPPNIKPAAFPDAQMARDLSHMYFEHANPQIPILHRGEFSRFLDRIYSHELQSVPARARFFINITCAIGSGVIMDKSDEQDQQSTDEQINNHYGTRSLRNRAEPEQYYAAALSCLDSFNSAPRAMESTPNGLEELQALLLASYYAVQRPVAPGLWYIAGTAMRLAKILGLYHEAPEETVSESDGFQGTGTGRQFWVRDMRRRLWYCTYSIDRLVSVCVGRPTSIDETVITTPFPSNLDDVCITPEGIIPSVYSSSPPSYKLVAHHYFRLRLLQSEIMQVLESRRAQLSRATSAAQSTNPYLLGDLPEPFLARFNGDFRRWRADIDERLLAWKNEVPLQHETGVKFDPLFLDLNYWQTLVILYRHSLPVPQQLAGELDETSLEESKTARFADEENVEDEQMVYQKAGVAGQAVIGIYRQLHMSRLVNYTYLATHHIFICGVTFLYSIWQSPQVRQSLQPEDIELTVLAATTVLTGLIPKCPPAESARDAFKRMSKVTLAFYMASTRQGTSHQTRSIPMMPTSMSTPPSRQGSKGARTKVPPLGMPTNGTGRRAPQFDTNFKNLFSEEEMSLRSPELPLPKKYRPVFDSNRYNQRPTSNTGMGSSDDMQPVEQPSTTSVPIETLLEDSPRYAQSQQTQLAPSPHAPSLQSIGSDGHYFDDSIWDTFGGDNQQVWGGEALGEAGMGFELGFGAGGNPQWPEQRGFEMLDGWLLGGGTGFGSGDEGTG